MSRTKNPGPVGAKVRRDLLRARQRALQSDTSREPVQYPGASNSFNAKGDYEIIIGNDFAVPDRYFTFVDGNWQEQEPPPVMPHSTMSYDAADLDNDGLVEVYAVDMKPYADDDETQAQWQPVMDMMMAMPHEKGDPQIMENVLYAGGGAGLVKNIAPQLDLDGTGWSWSAKFGDLDNDGFQDLTVVNGMISREMFSHLPNDELVEENQVYRNLSGGRFVPQPGWALNDTASGRGMSLATWTTMATWISWSTIY